MSVGIEIADTISVNVCNAYYETISVKCGDDKVVVKSENKGGGAGFGIGDIAEIRGSGNENYIIQQIGTIGFTEIGPGKYMSFDTSTDEVYLTIRSVNGKELCFNKEIIKSSSYIVDAEGQLNRGSKKPNYWIDMDGVNHKASVDIQLKAYTEAIKDGFEQSRTVRVMVIGNGEVGKSFLTKNLIGELQTDVSSSTDGIEVHTCTTDASGLWKTHKGTAKEIEADRLAHIVHQNKVSDKTNVVEKESSRNTLIKKVRDRVARVFHRQAKRNLTAIDEQRTSDKQVNSTDAHNVVKQPKLSLNKYLRIRDHEKGNTQETRFVKIWDFGGQFVYYATHQLFHSRHAVYLLVLNASMNLENKVEDNQYPGQTTTKTVKHYCKFWMNSIQSYVGTEIGDAPPVILVATHIDKVEGGWDENIFFESVLKIFDGTILANHIQPNTFALSNTRSTSNEFERLRNYIMKVADEQQMKDMLRQPARWIALETSIMEHIDQRHISLDELRSFDMENELSIDNHDQLLAFLKLHHSLGDLVYFDDEGLSETIIIDPQWIIDAFKSFITSTRFCRTKVYRAKKKELDEEAKLSNDFIESVWNEDENKDFKDNKDKLLRYMSKLGILAKVYEVDIDTGEVRYCDFYIVPSLLHTHMPGDVLERVLKSGTGTCTGTTTALVFEFVNQYVSPTLYNRITAAALGKWNVLVSNGTRLLFDDIGMYELDPVHSGIIERRDASIEIRVINRCSKDINYENSDRLRRLVKHVIQMEHRRSGVRRAKLYTEHIRCNFNNVTGDKTKPCRELIKYKECPCPDNSPEHILRLDIVQKEWQLVNEEKIKLLHDRLHSKEILDKILTKSEITKVATAFDEDWQVLGESLGLAELEIEAIIENDDCNKARNMLTKWIDKEGKRATLAALVKQIIDTSARGVNLDKFNTILDKLSDCYDTIGKKGMLLILNSTENRKGTDADVEKLRTFFGDTLGFEILDPRQTSKKDLTSKETRKHLKNARDALIGNQSETYYCFICVILSHGKQGHIKTKDGFLNIKKDIREYFSNENMQRFAGRPKCFFVQSCRVEDKKNVDEVDDCSTKKKKKVAEDEPDVDTIKIPNEADILMAYATTTGKYAFRRIERYEGDEAGSWFIIECMNEFTKNWGQKHVEDMLITVRQRVAHWNTTHEQVKQMPIVETTMLKRLYLAEDDTHK